MKLKIVFFLIIVFLILIIAQMHDVFTVLKDNTPKYMYL